MLLLALANLTHRKVRSALSILAVAIAITLLLVLVGLSNGTLNEVSSRMQSVEAEIVVRDKHFDLGSMSGGKLWEKEIKLIEEIEIDAQPAVEKVIPVFLGRIKLAGLSQNVFGVDPDDFAIFAGRRKIKEGQLFEDDEKPNPITTSQNTDSSFYLPLLIDQRLSRAGNIHVGDEFTFGDTPARVAGIVETGVAGRVFAPINRLRAVNGISVPTAHMFFVKAKSSLNTEQLQILCEKIEMTTKRSASLVANYAQVLADNYRNLTIFISLVSVIALVICFLFIFVTMYTIVLERGKEIAILQSLGANRSAILRQTIQESLLICSLGTFTGILMALGVRWLIETLLPLMTIEIKIEWLLIAAAVGIGGGIISAVYPGYLALQHDPVEALSFE
jgi:ABC-type antimicrobial peptide transport system permease subunit